MRRAAMKTAAPAAPKSTANVGTLTWYGLSATTHEHACHCGQAIPCARPAPCVIEEWRCGVHLEPSKKKCAWCSGTGVYARAYADPDGKVACGYCLGTGEARWVISRPRAAAGASAPPTPDVEGDHCSITWHHAPHDSCSGAGGSFVPTPDAELTALRDVEAAARRVVGCDGYDGLDELRTALARASRGAASPGSAEGPPHADDLLRYHHAEQAREQARQERGDRR